MWLAETVRGYFLIRSLNLGIIPGRPICDSEPADTRGFLIVHLRCTAPSPPAGKKILWTANVR